MSPKVTKAQLTELARGVVLAQGNLFIKELLKAKGLPIGSTKADFTKNMLHAIDEGALTEVGPSLFPIVWRLSNKLGRSYSCG